MTPEFQSVLDAAGAIRGEGFGRPVVTGFGDVGAEYAALRSGCALLDAGFRGFGCLTGEDRTTFVQGMVSNDVAKLAPGEGVHAAILTVQGRVVTDLRIYVLDGSIWFDFPAHRRTTGLETLEKYVVADDVEFVEPPLAPLVLLEGRTAPAVFDAAFGVAVESLARCAHREFHFAGTPLRVVAVTHSGETGYLIAGPHAVATALWERARHAGAVPVGADALDIARVEAGIPLIDADMDESYLAPEVGLADAISFRKGCYIGQEVVERVASRGNVQKKLVGLRLEGTTAVPPQAAFLADGKDAGFVTSCVVSPDLGVIALGYARRAVWDSGTHVDVAVGDTLRSATVVDLPLVTPGT
jgi:folate-binding protein YgfZ